MDAAIPDNLSLRANLSVKLNELSCSPVQVSQTDSGIPDFRGPNGVWTKNPAAEKASNISFYLAEPEVRRAAWQSRLETSAWTAEPNRGHLAVVDLERSGRLHALVTQNIDGLHQRAGVDPDLVIEVHGTIWYSRCWECGDRRLMEEMCSASATVKLTQRVNYVAAL